MKGILKNTPTGWFVLHQVMRDEITSGYDSIPLRPDSESLWMFAELKEGWKDQLDGKEVYFEIERYCKKHNSDPSKNSVCTLDCGYEEVKYARVIWPSNETATLGCSYPDCICQGDEITYCNNRTPEQVVLGDKTALVENVFHQGIEKKHSQQVDFSNPNADKITSNTTANKLSFRERCRIGNYTPFNIENLMGELSKKKKANYLTQEEFEEFHNTIMDGLNIPRYGMQEVEVSLPGCELSDIDSLKYFFQTYLYSVENGKPDQNKATLLKTWIDIIQ